MKFFRLQIVAALALLCGVSLAAKSASAAIVTVTYSGTVAYDSDPNNMISSSNLVGDSYVATYTFNTSLGTTCSVPTCSYNSAYGGGYYDNTSPLLSALVTINGNINFSLTQYNEAGIFGQSNIPGQQLGEQEAQVQDDVYNSVDNYIWTNIYPGTEGESFPGSITTPFTYTVSSGDTARSEIYLSSCDLGYCPASADLVADITTETLSTSTTPLPATLPLFAGGLGFVGYLARRRKKNGNQPLAAA